MIDYSGFSDKFSVIMSNVQCVGNESALIDCLHSEGGSGSHVALRCSSDGE